MLLSPKKQESQSNVSVITMYNNHENYNPNDEEQSFDSSIVSENNEAKVPEPVLKSSQNLILVSGSHQIGKISKRHPKCEDAYFITENAFGLSDGVSGWNDYGFSSDEFSKQLMQNSKNLIDKRLVELKRIQRKPTTLEKVKIILSKTKSVLSMRNYSNEIANKEMTKNSTLKMLNQSNDDSIRTSNRANNETHSFNSSASSHYMLNITS